MKISKTVPASKRLSPDEKDAPVPELEGVASASECTGLTPAWTEPEDSAVTRPKGC